MRPRDIALAILISIVWGCAFIATKFGLQSFTPSQLTALRFLIACIPAAVLVRPSISWPSLVAIELTLFTGQFLLLFFAMKVGLPPGVASITQQMQAFFTVLLAALFLREMPTRKQSFGMVIAFIGLALIGATIGGDMTTNGLVLGLGSALSWACGNLLLKRNPGLPMLPLMVWLSLIPPLPALAVSEAFDGVGLVASTIHASWASLASAVYLGAIATVAAYAVWGQLLARYSAAQVTPFALLSPCAGTIGSWLAFGEVFGPVRYLGMLLILIGIATVALPLGWLGRMGPRTAE
jgi:O-acetylserine/cysteine efflux transporter